jgi:hypothetical protein
MAHTQSLVYVKFVTEISYSILFKWWRLAMTGKLLTLAGLFLLAHSGCRSCSNCGDYSPPLVGSSQSWGGPRAGSRFVQPIEIDADETPDLNSE